MNRSLVFLVVGAILALAVPSLGRAQGLATRPLVEHFERPT